MIPETSPDRRRARQKTILTALALVLMAGGLVVLGLLTRLPFPVRLVMGCSDFLAAAVLLLLVRQKFPAR
jgi:hypothetical protein